MLEIQLLNAVIAKRDFSALVKHNLANENMYHEQACAYRFIKKHLGEFGELPSVESVITNCPDFEYVDVVESIDTLAMKIIERNLKMEEKQLLQELAAGFGNMDAYKILERLTAKVEDLQQKAAARGKNGSNWAQNGEERFENYEARKKKDFSKKLPCMFDEFTDAVGGYELGELVTIMGFTGRGKSWLGLLSALMANNSGHKVLIESAEMSKTENEFRLDTLEGGFSNRGLWTGQLGFTEDEYKKYTERFTKENSTRADMIIKTAEDWADGLSIEQLEHDIDKTKCDMVIIDQFNLLKFKGNSRDDKTAVSRQLKQLAAKKSVVIILLYQTNGDYEKSKGKSEGIRELKTPTLQDYSETIAVIQDSNKIFGFDSVTWRDEATGRQRGKALVTAVKSRSGGEGLELELNWCPNDGVMHPRAETDMF
jgi:replicative DNA helicase